MKGLEIALYAMWGLSFVIVMVAWINLLLIYRSMKRDPRKLRAKGAGRSMTDEDMDMDEPYSGETCVYCEWAIDADGHEPDCYIGKLEWGKRRAKSRE